MLRDKFQIPTLVTTDKLVHMDDRLNTKDSQK